jgi:uncharacterized protein YgiM (DUF1202 family)
MKIIQTQFLKNILTVAILVLSIYKVSAQSHSSELKKADSLFQSKQYTQSFELYAAVLKEKQYSPAMLLKMAYIQEGLGHTSKSLYYLHLYYLASNDEQALTKMEEIAVKNRLEGYQSSDLSTFLLELRQYSFQITAVLLSVTLFFFAFIFYQKIRQYKKPIVAAFVLIFFLSLLYIQIHFTDYMKVGIVTESATYLMSGPSAGSNVVAIIDEGHQLKILGQTDVWIKVNWNEKEVFIKEQAILPVHL